MFPISSVFAETEYIKVADNSYERKYFDLKQGDEIEYSITVSGGANDDVNFTIYYPHGGDDDGGRVYEKYAGGFMAQSSGTYIFEFDNTFSVFSNKDVIFEYEITKNTYYVYVDKIPAEGKDNAASAVVKASEYWKQIYPKKQFYVADSESQTDIIVTWVKDYGLQKHIGLKFQELVQVALGDSRCGGNWHPFSSYTVEGLMTHEIGHAIGLGHSENPANIMYPTTETNYGPIEKKFSVDEGHALFVYGCTTKNTTKMNYQVISDNERNGFDVYFVPSQESVENWSEHEKFEIYSDSKCFGEGYVNYPGTCQVEFGSGLLIIMDKKLIGSKANITVKFSETINPSGKVAKTQWISYIYESETIPDVVSSPVQKPPQASEIKCGSGTVLKNGVCVPENSQSSNVGGCLIATATFGTELAPQVQQLREIRDNSLLQTESGRSFMESFNQLYYSFSPGIADLERENPVFKEAVKLTITPLLSSLSLLNYVDMDSEETVLGYGISLILLNIGMYFVAPVLIVIRIFRIKCNNLGQFVPKQ